MLPPELGERLSKESRLGDRRLAFPAETEPLRRKLPLGLSDPLSRLCDRSLALPPTVDPPALLASETLSMESLGLGGGVPPLSESEGEVRLRDGDPGVALPRELVEEVLLRDLVAKGRESPRAFATDVWGWTPCESDVEGSSAALIKTSTIGTYVAATKVLKSSFHLSAA